jgi:N-acetylglucosamine kinase-like BadF-type ATPase
VGLEGTRTALGEVLIKAANDAGISLQQIEASVFGLGGVDWPSDLDRLEPIVAGLGLSGRHLILNDTFVALRAGTDLPMGVVIIAGSGTTVAARNLRGETYRTLGQGPPLFDDFGSANHVAERAVQAVARAYTGRGPETSLSTRLCEMTGATGAIELLEGLSRDLIPMPASAPVVLAEAEAGDAVAQEIVRDVGSALGDSAAVAIRRLEMEHEVFDVVLAGGLFRGSNQLLRDAIDGAVRAAAPEARLVRLASPPVAGAGLLALEMIGERPTSELRLKLSEACAIAAREQPPDRTG